MWTLVLQRHVRTYSSSHWKRWFRKHPLKTPDLHGRGPEPPHVNSIFISLRGRREWFKTRNKTSLFTNARSCRHLHHGGFFSVRWMSGSLLGRRLVTVRGSLKIINASPRTRSLTLTTSKWRVSIRDGRIFKERAHCGNSLRVPGFSSYDQTFWLNYGSVTFLWWINYNV